MRLRRVLVPVDLSSESLQALEHAIDFGTAFEPQFIVLYVEEPLRPFVAGQVQGMLPVTAIEEQRRHARAELAAVKQRVAERGIRIRTLIEEGSPYGTIVEVAERLKADLIVMSTHGRTGVARALLGSVAEMVRRHAACPVLTVRPAAKRKRAPAKRRAPRHR